MEQGCRLTEKTSCDKDYLFAKFGGPDNNPLAFTMRFNINKLKNN